MRTDDLIAALAKDQAVRSPRPRTAIICALVAGGVIAAILFMSMLSHRPDIAEAAQTYRFLFKFVFTLTLAASAIGLVFQIFRPEASPGRRLWLIALAPGMLLAAALGELLVMPSSTWLPGMIGIKPLFCFFAICSLSIGPLLAFFAALRYGAPSNPGLAGALAGLSSAGIGAALFVFHCPNDSPLFVVVWYSLAIGLVTLIGYFAGKRWLAW
ncbi:MAG: DUF1109 family protein [Alphaproteobacteria bacterium]|nr:MAG: DUF1109 family protein [Alphaproteobacteria bacterium]